MEGDNQELLDSVAASTSRAVLSFCIKGLMRGSTSQRQLEQSEETRLKDCLNNFSYSYVVVADAWMSSISENLKQENPK
jgi:hypothetical protein